jgi:fermentation-respiration switch protein FrsA (DUF1100 family)
MTSAENGSRIQKISIPERDHSLAGNLYLPANFDETKQYPAIVVVHPNGGVKEQTAGVYSRKLAEKGYVTIVFDASYQGESGGTPHSLEDPHARTEDVSYAIDYLNALGYVDDGRIGALGICAGGGYAAHAAQTDHRIKAVAGISAFDTGRARRRGYGDTLDYADMQKILAEAAEQRTKEAKGEAVRYSVYVPPTEKDIPAHAPAAYREGYEYYRTARGGHPRSDNQWRYTSYPQLIGFTAFDHPEWIAPRPILQIVGSRAESAYFGKDAIDRAREPKELFVIDGASHIDLYDKPEYVPQAVNKLADFFGKNL